MNGARKLGCCCHVSSIISYLFYGYDICAKTKKPTEYLNSIFPVLNGQNESDSGDEFTQNQKKNIRKSDV